jgi:hypothetical protein
MPTAIASELLTEFRAHLISKSIVRDPRTAGSEPVMWIEPRDGVPAPGEMEGTENSDEAVLGVFRSGGFPPTWIEQRYVQRPTIDVVLRTRTAKIRDEIGQAIEEEILGSGGGGEIKMEWQMGAMTVIQSSLWRALQPLGSDQDGFTATVSFLFELYTSNA